MNRQTESNKNRSTRFYSMNFLDRIIAIYVIKKDEMCRDDNFRLDPYLSLLPSVNNWVRL
jgi:hypothetical protein